MTASQHMVKANGLRFRAMVEGPAEAPMVLLLHGFPEGAESWARQMKGLAEAGFLAVAPDLRGYGLTEAPEGVDNYHLDHLVEDVRGLIEAFGRKAAHVAGHDWGAIMGWFFAGKYPEMTTTWTALSVAHPAAVARASRDDPDQQARSSYVGLFVQEGKAEQVLAGEDWQRLRLMYKFGPNPDAVPDAIVTHFVRSLQRPGRMTAALNYYRANLNVDGGAWSKLVELGDITPSTLLVWGDEDPALGRTGVDATPQFMKGPYRLEVLQGAGHWLQFERPAEVTSELLRHIRTS